MSIKGTPRLSGLKGFASFEGSAEDLALAADSVLASLGATGDEPSLNPRLVRDYAQREILTRPERQGKEAVYGYRQLVELVAARILLADGWPLAKVSDYVRSSKLEDLVALAVPRNPAKSAIRAIKDIRERSRGVQSPKSMDFGAASLRQWRDVTGRQAKLAELKAELPAHMSQLSAAYPRPLTNEYASVSLADDLHVLIGDTRLKALTLEEAEAIGKAVTASLIQLRPKGGKP